MKSIYSLALSLSYICFLSLSVQAQFIVNSDNDNDDGTCDVTHCSLREAINAANAAIGADSIVFEISGGGMAATISPTSALPTIIDEVTIDGSTQSCPATRCIELDGSGAGAALGLRIETINSTFSNLVINGFQNNGVLLGSTTSSNTVENCYIGTNFAGTAADANGWGIGISGGDNNIIRGNLISGNTNQGITGFNNSDGNIIEGNSIGIGTTGTQAIPNGLGGIIFSGSSDNNIIRNNTIANNGLVGVQFNDGTGNTVSQNQIYDNTNLGIELLPGGVNANDIGDGDSGTNNLQNSPELGSAALTLGLAKSLIVNYRVPSDPANSSYPIVVEFFLVDSDNEEGAVYLGSDVYGLSDAQLERNSSIVTQADVPVGATIIATATDANGNTSEFSASRALQTAFVVNTTSDTDDGTCDLTHCSLREAIRLSNNFAGADRINFGIAGGGTVQTIQVTSQLPLITDRVVIDGSTQNCPSTRCIELDGSPATGTVDGLQISNSSGSLITGMIINRFTDDGISIVGASSTNNTITNCSIGTNATGDAIWGSKSIPTQKATPDPAKGGKDEDPRLAGSFGNGYGIYIVDNASQNVVVGNTISGNSNQGVWLTSSTVSNTIRGNIIGTDETGLIALPNSTGIDTQGNNNLIESNTIAFNTLNGVRVVSGVSHRILQNSIYRNGGEGIDLDNDGPTGNDSDDADTGANNLQNYPEITFASYSALATNLTDALTIEYSVSSSTSYSAYPLTVEFFAADEDGEEGKQFIGEALYTTSASSVFVDLTPAFDVPVGSMILATATDANGNTSEFSAPAVVLNSGESVYWIDLGANPIMRGNKDGLGSAITLFDTSDDFSGQSGIEIDSQAGKIYWDEENRIVRANMDGSGIIEVLYDATNGLAFVADIELDIELGMLYWMDPGANQLNRAPADGSGPVETLFSSTDPGISSSFNLALDRASGKIYWASFSSSSGPDTGLFRGDIEGGNVERIAEVLNVSHIELDLSQDMIYWTSRESGAEGIKRMRVDGSGGIETIYDSPRPEFLELDRDRGLVYWTDSSSDELLRGSMEGSTPVENIYDTEGDPEGIALEGQQEDFTIHVKRPSGWGLPRISFDNLPFGGIAIPEPGIAMTSEGCTWFSYTFRGISSASLIRISGNDSGLRSEDLSLGAEAWVELGDPGGGADWLPTFISPPIDYTNCFEGLSLAIKVQLAGPYNATGDEMDLGLQSNNLIPYKQGYGDPIFANTPQGYGGEESWLQLRDGESDAVDWVIVELRTDPNDPLTTVASKAGVLLKCGMIVDPRLGATALSIPAPPGNYYIVVRHRNHLPVMSASSVDLLATTSTGYDFTTGQAQAFGTNPMIQVDASPLTFAMRGADGNATQDITSNDFTQIWLPQNGGSLAYEQADFDMTGDVTAFDFLNVWLPNNGQSSQVP